MKKFIQVVLVSLFFMGIAHAASSDSATTPSQKNQIQLASNCPSSCKSCALLCTKNDDCGTGHKCVTATDGCSSSCVKEEAN